jgi:flagellar assembly factor FliW
MIRTTRFGEIDVPPSQVIHLPLGLPGFPDAKAFVLVEHRPGSKFRWLQATHAPDIAFIVVDVASFMPEYPFADVRHALAFCDLEPDEELAVLAICCVPAPPGEPTANLKAPVGIGLRSRRGGQVLLHGSGLEMDVPLFPGM